LVVSNRITDFFSQAAIRIDLEVERQERERERKIKAINQLIVMNENLIRDRLQNQQSRMDGR
jgi:hypothetical protein